MYREGYGNNPMCYNFNRNYPKSIKECVIQRKRNGYWSVEGKKTSVTQGKKSFIRN